MGKVINFAPYAHVCFPSVWKKMGVCPLCELHRKKLAKHMLDSRLRAKHRRGIVKE